MVHRSPGQDSCRVLRTGANVFFPAFFLKRTRQRKLCEFVVILVGEVA